jgi:hypothetical protein
VSELAAALGVLGAGVIAVVGWGAVFLWAATYKAPSGSELLARDGWFDCPDCGTLKPPEEGDCLICAAERDWASARATYKRIARGRTD